MISRAREEGDSDTDGGENIATKKDEGEKKPFYEVEGDLLHCSPEVRNRMSNNFSCKADLVYFCEQAVHFWRNGLLYGL